MISQQNVDWEFLLRSGHPALGARRADGAPELVLLIRVVQVGETWWAAGHLTNPTGRVGIRMLTPTGIGPRSVPLRFAMGGKPQTSHIPTYLFDGQLVPFLKPVSLDASDLQGV